VGSHGREQVKQSVSQVGKPGERLRSDQTQSRTRPRAARKFAPCKVRYVPCEPR
jgi:hypothetical protein